MSHRMYAEVAIEVEVEVDYDGGSWRGLQEAALEAIVDVLEEKAVKWLRIGFPLEKPRK